MWRHVGRVSRELSRPLSRVIVPHATLRTSAMLRAPLPASLEAYGLMSFEGEVMRDYLDRSSYAEIRQALDTKQPLTPVQMEAYAKAALQWAFDRGMPLPPF